jgi:hypothetical protein
MGKKGRVLPFVRPVSHGAAEDAVGSMSASPSSASTAPEAPASNAPEASPSRAPEASPSRAPGASANTAREPIAGGQPSRPPAPPLPKRIPGSARPMPGKGQARRTPRPGGVLPIWASQPDPDRVIEPETSRPEAPGGPVTRSDAPRPEPPAKPVTRSDAPRPEPPAKPVTRSDAPRPGPPAKPVTGPMVLRPDALAKPQPSQPSQLPQAPQRRPSQALEPAASRTGSEVTPSRTGSEVTPSWSAVVATTVRLWVERRRTGWRVAVALVAALIVFAAGGLTVALLRNAGPKSTTRSGGTASGPPGLGPVQAAATARQQAATWVAAQISHSAVVSCDPAMCAALQAKGFPAGDLMTLGPAASDPLGSAVIVATAAIRSEFGSRLTSVYAPTVIASFGSGSAQVDVRVYAAGGAAAYLAALRADELSRRSDGSQLLRNSRVSAAPAARQQLAAGQVDSRLLITIATLSGQGPVSILAFGDSGQGASPGVPLRLAELASPPRAKSGYLQSVVALLRAQQEPYLANSVTLTRLASGQEVVRVEFAAPSPLGLLSG